MFTLCKTIGINPESSGNTFLSSKTETLQHTATLTLGNQEMSMLLSMENDIDA